MRAIVQRVSSSSVSVEGREVSKINRGITVLVGINRKDTTKDAEYISRKIVNMRLFANDDGKMWTKSCKDLNYEIMLVSQFTLYGIMKGNKPDFHESMGPKEANEMFRNVVDMVKKQHSDANLVKEGEFGAMMDVDIQNDGPVTIPLDSWKFEYK
eukprot:gb/GECH01014817.1/.p1 GENE.gb/GECH01014817.1/~~gb/GECH01014817.1/.p1  ORF type:complete len:155 (+),score=19.24 gb/GECH01014817.1/:1-465(+)